MILWSLDSTAALKCNGYGSESLLVGHSDKDSENWKGLWYVKYKVVYTGGTNLIKVIFRCENYQDQMTHQVLLPGFR